MCMAFHLICLLWLIYFRSGTSSIIEYFFKSYLSVSVSYNPIISYDLSDQYLQHLHRDCSDVRLFFSNLQITVGILRGFLFGSTSVNSNNHTL